MRSPRHAAMAAAVAMEIHIAPAKPKALLPIVKVTLGRPA
ncbi:hypothetical protein MM1S1540310_4375 [Mycobacteroides abscessus subsp. bolletii 1S-154-0310]|nr:hypothetical protein MM1S1530915_4369 [Mycobacteroides abscessus subsp. bolletii 1S-153-0915]EIU75904.1 hypothetical protein MM1S1540310_4375 [Mycobacteroides abscessus subsp. bolletii 1S-154-0310]